MTNNEPIDQWRADFEKFISSPPYEKSTEKHGDKSAWCGSYMDIAVDLAWQSFMEAKRSQPVIELPKCDTHCFDEDEQKDVWSHSPKSITDAITAAGYQYRIKE